MGNYDSHHTLLHKLLIVGTQPGVREKERKELEEKQRKQSSEMRSSEVE